ncbi:MAG TPA: hypothetical protein VGM37_19535 [Armatimonadota bacterium]|jgi:hypothetical protein
MLPELALKFVSGGLAVSAFAAAGDALRPKSVAGVFAAAASVALATLGMAFAKHGGDYAAAEGRSMVLGGVALIAYTLVVGRALLKTRRPAWLIAGAGRIVWLAASFALYVAWRAVA